MKSHEKFLAEARDIICEIAAQQGLELIDVEYQREPGGWVLRVLIDRQPGGITIGDCTDISREIGDVLEVKDIMAFPYRLEVSSPGVNRPLKKVQDFEQHLGETVSITTLEPLDGRKHFKGKLSGLHGDLVEVAIDGQGLTVPLAAVKKARVEYDFDKDKHQKKKHS
jgi:ribosome maturation factor RimP